MPKPSKRDGIDRGRRAAIEPRELVVGDEAEPADPARVELRLVSPALSAGDREQEIAAEQPVGIDEGLEVLPWLESRDGEQVRAPRGRPRGHPGETPAARPGARRAPAPPRTPSGRDHVVARVRGVDEHDVARLARCSGTCARASSAFAESSIRDGAAGRGRGSSSPALRRAAAGTSSPRSAARRTRREAARRQAARRRSRPFAAHGRTAARQVRSSTSIPASARSNPLGPLRGWSARTRRSRALAGGLDEPAERPADVVADPERRMGERRDVERDPHDAGPVVETLKWAPSSRRSVLSREHLSGHGRRGHPERDDARVLRRARAARGASLACSGSSRTRATRRPADERVHPLRRLEQRRVARQRHDQLAAAAQPAPFPRHGLPRPGVVRVETSDRGRRDDVATDPPERRSRGDRRGRRLRRPG